MAADQDAVIHNYSDDASITLLRRLRAGAAVHFVHFLDVCSATPEDLVADLEPAPGTDGTWYFYCPKKYKNAQGKASGHRQRAIGGSDTCWHAEARPKEVVEGSEAAAGGGTACNLSYGRKDGRSFSRLGWCMMEYDITDGGDCVLCKVYRSSRAQVKKTPPSSGKSVSSSKAAKRKAAGGEHPEARPAKLSHEQEFYYVDPQVQKPLLVAGHEMTMPECQFPAEAEQVQVQDNTLVTVTQQSQHNTQTPLPAQGAPDWAEEIDQDLMFTMDELLGVAGSCEDVVMQNTQPDQFQHNTPVTEQFQHNTPVTEQFQHNTPVTEQFQHNNPVTEQFQHNTQSQLQRNKISSIEELLRFYGFSEEVIKQYSISEDELFGSCSGTPTAMAPPYADFSQGLAF